MKQKKQYCRPRSNVGHIFVDSWAGNYRENVRATVDMNPRKRWEWQEMTLGGIKAWRGSLTLYMNRDEFDRIFQTKKRDGRSE